MGASQIIVIYLSVVACSLLLNYNVLCDEVQNVNKTSHEINNTQLNNASSTIITSTQISEEKSPSPLLKNTEVAEGGHILLNDTTHMGREHMIKVNLSMHEPKLINNNTLNETRKVEIFPFEVPEKNDDKKSVPRKGVDIANAPVNGNLHNHTSTTTTTTTTTPKPKIKKPKITEPSDDVPYIPSDFETKSKSNETKNQTGQKLVSIEAVTQKQKKVDYVVPIVAVILSVPLVAIVFSVLYKRGAEWWKYRHYRRMDFLIEGMYNN